MSVSSVQPAPPPASRIDPNDAASVLRPDGIAELGFLLRKVLDARAQYEADHPNARAALHKLNERLSLLFQTSQTLTIDVGSTQFSIAANPLNRNTSEPDLISQALFNDGARKIVISRGLTMAQLGQFLEVAARKRRSDSDQSVMTDFWEAELANIQFVVATTFAEEGNESLEVDAPGAQKSHRELLASVMGVFTNPDLSAAMASDDLPTMIALSAAELEVLSSSSLSGIEQGNLKEHDAAGRDSVLGVDAETLRTLRNRLSQPRADASERLLASHFDAAVAAPADLKPKVMESLQTLMDGLISSNRLEPAARAIDQQLQLARSDQAIAAQRLPVINQLRQKLMDTPIVDTLIQALDDAHLSIHAIPLMRVFGTLALDRLLEAPSKFKTEVGKHNVSKLLGLLNPKPEVLATKVKGATPDAAREIVLLCNKQPPSVVAPILGVLLQSHDAPIRRVAVRTLDKTVALGVSPLLRRMIGDPDREVRLVVVRLLAYAEDTASVELMNKTLVRQATDAAERREIYRALGEIGGLAAGDALTAELVRQSDVDLRIALIANFGRAWSPKAAQTVGELATKLLGNAKLRAACKVAVVKAEAEASGKTQATAPMVSSGSGLRPAVAPAYASSPSTIAHSAPIARPAAPSYSSASSTIAAAGGAPASPGAPLGAYPGSSPSTIARQPGGPPVGAPASTGASPPTSAPPAAPAGAYTGSSPSTIARQPGGTPVGTTASAGTSPSAIAPQAAPGAYAGSSPSTIARQPSGPPASGASPSTIAPQAAPGAYAGSSPSTIARQPSGTPVGTSASSGSSPSTIARQPSGTPVGAPVYPAPSTMPPQAAPPASVGASPSTIARQPTTPVAASSPSAAATGLPPTDAPAVPAYPRAPSPLARDLAPAGPGAPVFASSPSGLSRAQSSAAPIAYPPAPFSGTISISGDPLPPGAPVPKVGAPYTGSPSTIAISGEPLPTTVSLDGGPRPSAPSSAPGAGGTSSSGSGGQPK